MTQDRRVWDRSRADHDAQSGSFLRAAGGGTNVDSVSDLYPKWGVELRLIDGKLATYGPVGSMPDGGRKLLDDATLGRSSSSFGRSALMTGLISGSGPSQCWPARPMTAEELERVLRRYPGDI